MEMRDDADVLDVLAVGRVVPRDGEDERGAVVERVDRLYDALAERPLADEQRAAALAQRRSDDLGGARRVPVDEHDHGQGRRLARARAELLVHEVRAGKRDDGTAVEEERRDRDRLAEQTAWVAAQVEHEAGRALPVEAPELACDELRSTRAEAREAHVAP